MNKLTVELLDMLMAGRSVADDGRFGKDFEGRVKFLLGNVRGKAVSRQYLTDTRKLHQSIEIKSNGGKIGYTTERGYWTIQNYDLVIYANGYKGQGLEWILDNAIVAPANEFYQALADKALIKYGYDENKAVIVEYVQGLVSKKKAAAMKDLLTSFPTLYDWLIDMGIMKD